MKIKNQFFNQPRPVIGLLTTEKSVTIPGQDFTPQEIIRSFTQGRLLPNPEFTTIPVHSFMRMDIQDKMEYLKQIRITNQEHKFQVQEKIKQLSNDLKIENAKKENAKLRNEIETELKKRDDEKSK